MNIQTIEREKEATQAQPDRQTVPPPLNPGDHLSRAEFERRYQAHPEIKKAELVEGVVYMPSPIRLAQHGEPHAQLVTWLGVYSASTSGTRLADNTTVRLDFENEVQPDAFLRILPGFGGKAKVTEDDYLEGPPELIIEIAASSAAYDLHDKKRMYARNGVQEYLAAQIYEKRIDWFTLREGVYEPLRPDDQGILRSEVFPGLWLKAEAFWAGDLAVMLAVLQEGLVSPEHAAFVEQVKSQANRSSDFSR